MLEDGGCYSRQEDQKERLQTLRVRHKLLVFYILIVHKNARLLIINLQASRQSWPFPKGCQIWAVANTRIKRNYNQITNRARIPEMV